MAVDLDAPDLLSIHVKRIDVSKIFSILLSFSLACYFFVCEVELRLCVELLDTVY